MQQELRKFNKDIQVTVSVDSIAKKLMEAMDQNNPHAALIVNTIVGSSLASGKIGYIYNAVNGWCDEINITVGKTYNIEGKLLGMYNAADGEKEKTVTVEVTEVDEYRDGNKVQVKYKYMRKYGADDIRETSDSTWVDHNSLIQIAEAMSKEMLLAIPG